MAIFSSEDQFRDLLPLRPIPSPNRPDTLPRPLTSFVGREREVAQVTALLSRNDVRLLTLTGPGGAGKTRLGLAVAERLRPAFADGVVFVPFETATDPAQAPVLIAQAAGVPDAPGQSLAERMDTFFRERAMLLVLDNLEHLPGVESHISGLLASSLHPRFLCTSRSRLGISGEQVYPVPVLPPVEATALFERRARAIEPDLVLDDRDATIVAQICDQLDGLPLAIELAAARIGVLPPMALSTQLAHQLALLVGGPRDAPARHQTMRNTIAWSHDLLAPDDQVLLRRLAVFSGGFTLDAAAAVMPGQSNTIDGLSALVASSLVRKSRGPRDEPRFALQPTVREYAGELLASQGEADQTRILHARYFLGLAEGAIPHYDGPENAVYRDRIEAELDNCRAAMAWSLDSGDWETAIRLSGAVWRNWWAGKATGSKAWTERIEEGLGWIERALPHRDGLPLPAVVEALIGAGSLNSRLGRATAARDYNLELLRESEARQCPYGEYWACLQRGMATLTQGDLAQARTWLERAAAVAPRIRNPENHEAIALGCLADVAKAGGKDVEALRLAEAAMHLARQCGNPFCISWLGLMIGRLRLKSGDLHGAAAVLVEGTRSYLAFDDAGGARASLTELGRVALAMDQPDLSARFLFAVHWWPAHDHDRPVHDEAIASLERCLGSALWERPRAEDTRQAIDDLMDLAVTLSTSTAVDQPRPPAPPDILTAREVDVLRLLVDGRPNREIADALSISERTVENHVAHILAKLDLDSRTAAATWAVRNGLA